MTPLSLTPYAVGFLLAFVTFAAIRRTGRLSPEFSPIAAAIMCGPILVGIAGIVTTSVLALGAGENFSLKLLAIAWSFTLALFAPTVLVVVPLLTFYLLRALQKKRLLSGVLVSVIGVCCIAAQLVCFYAFANALD